MTATGNKWDTLAAWLQGANKSAADDDKTTDKTTVKSPEDGARGSENCKDVKKLVGGNSTESANKPSESGRADNMKSTTGLAQTTTGKMPEVEKAIKTVGEESAKMAAANLNDATQLNSAYDSLLKAAAELPVLLAASGVPSYRTQPQSQKITTHEQYKQAHDKAAADTIENYRRHGELNADLSLGYLQGFHQTYSWLKQAADDGTLAQMLQAGGGGEGGAGGDPGAGGPPPGGDAGGMPPEAMAAAAGGGDPGAGGPPDAGGGAEPSMDDYTAGAAENGLSPQQIDELIALLQKMKEEQGPAMQPSEKAAVDRALIKAAYVASEVSDKLRSGKFQLKPAADGTPERLRREVAKNYFRELVRAAS